MPDDAGVAVARVGRLAAAAKVFSKAGNNQFNRLADTKTLELYLADKRRASLSAGQSFRSACRLQACLEDGQLCWRRGLGREPNAASNVNLALSAARRRRRHWQPEPSLGWTAWW
jgi:hypothetical protein